MNEDHSRQSVADHRDIVADHRDETADHREHELSKRENMNLRQSDSRIDDIHVMFFGNGMEPGLKDTILHMDRTLHGTPDEKGLVGRVTDLENKESIRNRNIGIASGVGMGVGVIGATAPTWIGKVIKLFTGNG